MPYYKNLGFHDVTYYGISVKPGEIAYFPGNVMNKYMIHVKSPSEHGKSKHHSESKNAIINRRRKSKQNANIEKVSRNSEEPVTSISMCDSVKVSNVVKNSSDNKETNDSNVVKEQVPVSPES